MRVNVKCRECGSEYKTYFGLERNEATENDRWKWAAEIEDESEFRCSCGKTVYPLKYMKTGLQGLLGKPVSEEEVEITPLYEGTALRRVREDFLDLINSNPKEEIVQKFIQKNPILLHMFSAKKIIEKPTIGTKYYADFAILDSRNDLILIEIERPNTRLMKKDGHRSQELIHAFDQVGDWKIRFEEHRISILDEIGVSPSEVNNVRGAVIAGREKGADASHLRALKMRRNDDLLVMTYDDIIGAMDTLITEIERR